MSKIIIPTATFMRSFEVAPVTIIRTNITITIPSTRLTRDGGIPASIRNMVASINPATTTLHEAMVLSSLHGIELTIQ